jgi:capsular exopolysaccharide synthesis family protein
MSYIYEALQRAETERAGTNSPKSDDSVAHLLQRVEQELERKRELYESGAESPTGLGSIAERAQNPEVQFAREEPVKAGPVEVSKSNDPAAVQVPVVEKVSDREDKREDKIAQIPLAVKPEISELEAFAQAAVIAPTLGTDARLVALTDQGSLAAEKFRMLGLKLRHLRDRRKLKRIVVTGTAPEEGKSLVAANLALNQSRSKVLKTLLIDGDLRRPTVASRFGCDGSLAGLSECLRGERQLVEVVYKLKGSGLWFLPAGRAPENPLELMQSGRLPELLDRLGKFFDWIIIDTPPVVPVADTTFWMKQADGVLVVIREGVSEKKVVERAFASFDRATLLGVVVNSCSNNDHEDYYSRYTQPAVRNQGPVPPGAEND